MSVMVDDQEKALQFYTSLLGFEKMADIPMGLIMAVVFEDTCANLINLVQPGS